MEVVVTRSIDHWSLTIIFVSCGAIRIIMTMRTLTLIFLCAAVSLSSCVRGKGGEEVATKNYVNVGDEVPEELYQAVAEILAVIFPFRNTYLNPVLMLYIDSIRMVPNCMGVLYRASMS